HPLSDHAVVRALVASARTAHPCRHSLARHPASHRLAARMGERSHRARVLALFRLVWLEGHCCELPGRRNGNPNPGDTGVVAPDGAASRIPAGRNRVRLPHATTEQSRAGATYRRGVGVMSWQLAALLLLGGSTALLFIGVPVALAFIAINIIGASLFL